MELHTSYMSCLNMLDRFHVIFSKFILGMDRLQDFFENSERDFFASVGSALASLCELLTRLEVPVQGSGELGVTEGFMGKP